MHVRAGKERFYSLFQILVKGLEDPSAGGGLGGGGRTRVVMAQEL